MNESPTLRELAKMIDHSLLHPTMTDEEVRQGCQLARQYDVATACVKPCSIPLAKEILAGSEVGVCPVIGFPHGNSTTAIKVREAEAAAQAGGSEIDMVVNVGKVLGGDWAYVSAEIESLFRLGRQRCGSRHDAKNDCRSFPNTHMRLHFIEFSSGRKRDRLKSVNGNAHD